MDKMKQGFTLVELLIAISIVGIISAVATQLLFDTVTTRSKQQSIENSSDDIQFFVFDITKSIQESKSINIPDAQTIEISKDTECIKMRYNSPDLSIEKAIDANPPCNPSLFVKTTQENTKITKLDFSPIGFLPKTVNIKVEGSVKDAFGDHPINFETNVMPRVSL